MLRIAGVRHADLKGYRTRAKTSNAHGARQRVRADARPGVHPRDEAVRGRDPRRRGRRRPTADDELYHILYDGTVMDEQGFTVLGGQAETIAEALGSALPARASTRRRDPARRRGARRGRRQHRSAADQLEVALLDRARAAPRVPPHQGRRARSAPRRLTRLAAPATRAIGATSRAGQREHGREHRHDHERRARPTHGQRGRRPWLGAGVAPLARRRHRGVDLARRGARSARRRAGPRARRRRPGPCRRR